MAASKKTTSKKGPRAVTDDAADAGDTNFFQQQREDDALDERHGEASKSLKQTALYANELAARLQASRKVTSSVPAIRHDLERVLELAALIQDEGQQALDLYSR